MSQAAHAEHVPDELAIDVQRAFGRCGVAVELQHWVFGHAGFDKG
jgi:hypothetical protein